MEKRRLKINFDRVVFTVIIFFVTIIFFSIFTPDNLFISIGNLINLERLIPDLGIVALAVGMLIICGEFDLSIAIILPMCSFVFTLLLMKGVNPWAALAVGLVAGIFLGFFNGFIVVKTQMSSFIITLGTMLFWKGILYAWSERNTIGIKPYISENSFFYNFLVGKIGGIAVQAIWFVFFAIILGIILHYHKYGNWIFATGDKKEVARAMGININIIKVACFILVGFCCAFIGISQLIRIETFAPTQGSGFEFKAVAAVVVGGVSLKGGKGNMLGIFLGVIIIQVIENGLILMRVPVFGVSAFIGAAIIIFVILNTYLENKLT
jgi:simple sugar transport system permease protein